MKNPGLKTKYSMRKIPFLIILFAILFVTAAPSYSEAMEGWRGGRHAPYGDYCPGPKRGWYGAKTEIKTAEEAEKILKEYFSQNEDVKIGKIKERGRFFEADIMDKNDVLIDIVIVNKRTGRIRSIY